MSSFDGISSDAYRAWDKVAPDAGRDAYTVSYKQFRALLDGTWLDEQARGSRYQPWPPELLQCWSAEMFDCVCVWEPDLPRWYPPLCKSKLNPTLHCCKELGHSGLHESAPIDTRKHTICWN